MSKTTKRTQQPTLDHADKAVNKPELGHAKDGDLPQSKNRSRWTREEDQFLRDNAGKLSAFELGEKLGRTRVATQTRATSLGISLKSTKPLLADRIRKLAGTMPMQDIAKTLGKTTGTVQAVAARERISLAYASKKERWTPAQDNYLRKNASLLTAVEISKVLGRSPASVHQRAGGLGVSLAKHHRAHQQWHGYKNQKAVSLKFKNRPLPDDCN